MSTFSKIINFIFEVQKENPELNRARYRALSKQIPLMYAILMVNIITMAYIHFQYAPYYLTMTLPIILTPITIARSILLIKSNIDALNDASINARLRTINYLAVIIGSVCVMWSISLFEYGNAYTQGYVAFFMCLTAIGVITSLMHLQQAAMIIAAIVVIPGSIFFGISDQPTYNAIAIDILLVVGIVLFIMFRYSRDFTSLIENQQKMEKQRELMKILNAKNEQLANLDSLTTLPNRRCFFYELNNILQENLVTEDPFVVGMLDLDGFKQINDLFGHAIGDQVLLETSARLRKLLDEDILVARLGGDEFGIIIPHPGSEQDIINFGDTICEALKRPFKIDGMKDGTVKISCTVGFASFPSAGDTASILFERADYALCYSKQNSKGNSVMFSQEHETLIREVSTIARHLKEADLKEELSVVFQPIVNTQTGRTICLESLARWDNPTLGKVPPDVFIRSAEQSGMINQLTSILLAKTLQAVAHWPQHIHVSFNLSTFDLCSKTAILNIINTMENSGVSAKRIIFEITETSVMENFDRALEGVDMLRDLGCKIALDDFGTGFSSLSYIQHLPIERLKIDRSFILNIETCSATRNIIRTIADLCYNLNLEGIVEGVETKQQLDILTDLGLHIIQGYYFSKPLPEDEILPFLEDEALQSESSDGTLPDSIPGSEKIDCALDKVQH